MPRFLARAGAVAVLLLVLLGASSSSASCPVRPDTSITRFPADHAITREEVPVVSTHTRSRSIYAVTTEPAITEPAPTEPAPTEPVTTEPAPTGKTAPEVGAGGYSSHASAPPVSPHLLVALSSVTMAVLRHLPC